MAKYSVLDHCTSLLPSKQYHGNLRSLSCHVRCDAGKPSLTPASIGDPAKGLAVLGGLQCTVPTHVPCWTVRAVRDVRRYRRRAVEENVNVLKFDMRVYLRILVPVVSSCNVLLVLTRTKTTDSPEDTIPCRQEERTGQYRDPTIRWRDWRSSLEALFCKLQVTALWTHV
jgi:hypothetical protein